MPRGRLAVVPGLCGTRRGNLADCKPCEAADADEPRLIAARNKRATGSCFHAMSVDAALPPLIQPASFPDVGSVRARIYSFAGRRWPPLPTRRVGTLVALRQRAFPPPASLAGVVRDTKQRGRGPRRRIAVGQKRCVLGSSPQMPASRVEQFATRAAVSKEKSVRCPLVVLLPACHCPQQGSGCNQGNVAMNGRVHAECRRGGGGVGRK